MTLPITGPLTMAGYSPLVDAEIAAAVAAFPITETFLSAAQTITSAGTATLVHGLSSKPKIIVGFIECLTAEHGYSIGDELEIPTFPQSTSVFNDLGLSIISDATSIIYRYGSSGTVFLGLNASTGVTSFLLNTRWQMFIRAFA